MGQDLSKESLPARLNHISKSKLEHFFMSDWDVMTTGAKTVGVTGMGERKLFFQKAK